MVPWFLLFFVTPILEMYVLIQVGGWLGAIPTVALVMLTAIIGIALLRRQGLATLARGMNKLQSGELPASEMAEGILLGVAGALLITPGFITDTTGFLLLVPACRRLLVKSLRSRVERVARSQSASSKKRDGGETVEGEFTRRS